MNRKIIGIITAGGLSLIAGAALAQSTQANQQPPPYTSSTPQSTQNGTNPTTANGMNDNGMSGNGNADMNGSAATGNGMNSGANSGQPPASFSTLDTQGNGYLTQQDASQNSWLGMHWAQCDADHDGKVTRMEYEACSQH